MIENVDVLVGGFPCRDHYKVSGVAGRPLAATPSEGERRDVAAFGRRIGAPQAVGVRPDNSIERTGPTPEAPATTSPCWPTGTPAHGSPRADSRGSSLASPPRAPGPRRRGTSQRPARSRRGPAGRPCGGQAGRSLGGVRVDLPREALEGEAADVGQLGEPSGRRLVAGDGEADARVAEFLLDLDCCVLAVHLGASRPGVYPDYTHPGDHLSRGGTQ